MPDHTMIDSLFPADLPEPRHWEEQYPPRGLPDGAEVTRLGPSPTGSLHIGGVYVATINADVARHSGGVYLVRIEDTDQARLVEGAREQFAEAFSYFRIEPDEDDATGRYGPYEQSRRSGIYLSYARDLLRRDQAYLCFATREELAQISEQQRTAGALPGYYGRWAIWRDAPADQVAARLAAGDPYVVRFRSPGLAGVRVSYTDAIRGELVQDDNRNDAVILKSSDQHPRLPTYHFAHAVDDHLMRVSLVIRGEEWISSVPLHLQLFDALGFERIPYAHIAPLMKQDGGSRRKLSKRKDPESSVSYYIEQGYPSEAMQYYIGGFFGPPALGAFVSRDFPLLTAGCSLPSTAQAYSLNFTVVPEGPLGFLSVWPAGSGYPGVSTLNSSDGSVIANAAIVPAGSNGAITVIASDPTNLIIDIDGYFAPPGASGLEFFPSSPCRIADTRATQPFMGAFGPPSLATFDGREFPLAASPCVPGTPLAYSLNMTVVPLGPLSFLSVWPVGLPYPGVSTLNSTDGVALANAAIVPAGTDGAYQLLANLISLPKAK